MVKQRIWRKAGEERWLGSPNRGPSEEVAKLSRVIQIDEGKVQAYLGEPLSCRVLSTHRSQEEHPGVPEAVAHQSRSSPSKNPKLRSLPFETAMIERYKRRESSADEALVKMSLAG